MKRGDIVTIYADPITRDRAEGQAKLIQKIGNMPDNMEYWEVKFTDDGYETLRTIKIK